jgi:hypothetical protein
VITTKTQADQLGTELGSSVAAAARDPGEVRVNLRGPSRLHENVWALLHGRSSRPKYQVTTIGQWLCSRSFVQLPLFIVYVRRHPSVRAVMSSPRGMATACMSLAHMNQMFAGASRCKSALVRFLPTCFRHGRMR